MNLLRQGVNKSSQQVCNIFSGPDRVTFSPERLAPCLDIDDMTSQIKIDKVT